MLNYIWAGLIIASLLFAGASDVGDLARDTYRNDQPLSVELAFPDGYDPAARLVPVEIRIDPDAYGSFYGTDARPATSYTGTVVRTEEGSQLRFAAGASLPDPLATIAGVSRSNDDELQGALVGFTPPAPPPAVAPAPTLADSAAIPPAGPPDAAAVTPPSPDAAARQPAAPTTRANIVFQPVRFVKINAMSAAALEFAGTAAEIAIGLIGVLALFLGFMKIAEAAGVVYAIVKLVRPVLRPLFPEVPPDHPALGMIALNLAANVFGLGNAATPFGIKAMEELQKLNPTSDTATNPMVMLLAINTASVQLVPPVLLLALMGLQINQLIFPILVTTALGLAVAIIAVKVYGRLPGVRASDPNRNPPPPAPAAGTV
jgi:spore maturation protein A